MDKPFTVVVSAREVDAAVAGALAGRAGEGRAEALIFGSEELIRLFEPATQQKLPHGYELVLCGLEVAHIDWDGRLVRPGLMDRLRKFGGVLRWFSNGLWEPEDRRAVGHLIGERNLVASEDAYSVAALVRDSYFGPDSEYEDSLVRFASRRLTEEEESDWGASLRKVLMALKGDRHGLAGAVADMMEGRIEQLIARHAEGAEETDEENRRFARERVGRLIQMRSMKLVCLSLPPARHAFWAEIGRYAREVARAELSLCRLEGRPVLLLACGEGPRADLRVWARYVTDMLPAARTVGPRRHVVPLVVRGLTEDPGLEREVLGLLADGAHLLRG